MHLDLASKYLEVHGKQYTQEQKAQFLRGTSFPDSRYSAGIPRTQTHDKDVTLQTVYSTNSPYIAGKKFHSWVDDIREELAEEWKIYDTLAALNSSPYEMRALFLKLIEDAILFNNSSHTPLDALALFSTIDPEALQYGINRTKILEWHAILTAYLSIQPNWLLRLDSLLLKKAPATWSSDVPRLAQEKVFIDYVNRLLAEFEKRFANFKPQ